MKCKRCNVEAVIYRQINQNGAKVVVERCPQCRTNPNTGQAFLPAKNYDWDTLPLFDDLTKDAPKCAVIGCFNIGVEYHHFAPRHLFDDADSWPTGYLCKIHHRDWHEKTRTGSYYNRDIK